MTDFASIYIYFGLVALVSLAVVMVSALFPAVKSEPIKYMPYESGIRTETHLFKERFPLHHYLVALIFLVFDVEVIFLFPWAVVGKSIGPFAFYEMLFFMIALLVGFAYVWRKRGLQWD